MCSKVVVGKKFSIHKMTFRLSSDLLNSIYACMPLDTFNKYNLPDSAWNHRFLYRYGKPLSITTEIGKRTYCIRAATEYSEVGEVTSQYCGSSVIYYHAALGDNWEFLIRALNERSSSQHKLFFPLRHTLGAMVPEIFVLACQRNQIEFVRKTAKTLLPFVSSDQDYIWTQEIFDLLFPYRDSCLLQLVAFADIPTFKQLIAPYLSNVEIVHILMEKIGGCNQRESQHEARVIEKIKYLAPHGLKLTSYLCLNMIINCELGNNDYLLIILYYNTVNMGHWIANYNEKVDYRGYRILKEHYLGLPRGPERAQQTVQILLEYEGKNRIIHPLIGYIRIIMGTLTVDEVKQYFDASHITNEIIVDLLDKKKYRVITELMHMSGDRVLNHYTAKDIDTINFLLFCKNINIDQFFLIIPVITLDLVQQMKSLERNLNLNIKTYRLLRMSLAI